MLELIKDAAVITLISMLLLIVGLAWNCINLCICIIVLIYLFFPLLVHLTTNKLTAKGEPFINSNHSSFIWVFVSPDYFWADKIKPADKDKRKNYIFVANKLNIIVSSFLFWGVFCFPLVEWIQFFLIARIISRSFEIIISFGKDVITKNGIENKKSSTNRFERIQLAIFSLLEIVVLNAGLYYSFSSDLPDAAAMIKSIITSFGVSLLVAVDIDKSTMISFFRMFQALTSFTLIVFAIASYLSNENNSKTSKYLRHKN